MIDLSIFAGRDDLRSYLRAPFALLDGAAATNGHILVYAEGAKADASSKDSLIAAATKLVQRARDVADVVPVQEIKAEPVACSWCEGTGLCEKVVCEDCDGEGEFWHGSHQYERMGV